MNQLHELEQPLRAWRTFRDIARATRTLAAAQAMHWFEQVRHAEAHLALCREFTQASPDARGPVRGRVVIAVGSDLGLCGSLNREVNERAATLAGEPTVLSVVIGARLASHAPLAGAVELATPSSFDALELRAAEIADLCAALPEPLDLTIVSTKAIEGDGRPLVEVRSLDEHEHEGGGVPTTSDLLGDRRQLATRARLLTRHAELVAVLARALACEHEARWRTMSRAFESANRKIAEQDQRLRKLRQEQITQEMLEARQAARSR